MTLAPGGISSPRQSAWHRLAPLKRTLSSITLRAGTPDEPVFRFKARRSAHRIASPPRSKKADVAAGRVLQLGGRGARLQILEAGTGIAPVAIRV